MKKVKLFFSLVSLCFLLSVMSFGVYSAISVAYTVSGSVEYEVPYKEIPYLTFTIDGDSAIVSGYKDSPTGVVIPETISVISTENGDIYVEGDDYKIVGIGDSAFKSCSSLTSINIPEEVTSIGNSAFEQCANLTTVNLPSELKTIGSRAFYGCGKWSGTLSIPRGVTSIGIRAFYRCQGLTGSVTIPSGITSIEDYTFYYCSGLTKINLPSGLKTIGSRAFYGCGKWSGTLSIPSGVTSIGSYAFYRCKGLTGSVTIPKGITSIEDSTFYYCSGLTEINLPSGLKTIGSEAFYGCSNWSGTLSIPSGVISIGQSAFEECSGLTSVKIPGSVETINSFAFANCSKLSSATIQNGVKTIDLCAFGYTSLTSFYIPASVTNIKGNIFCATGQIPDSSFVLTTITVNSSNSTYSSSSDGVLFNKNKTTLLIYPYGKTASSYTIPSSVKTIGEDAFRLCKSLTSVTIPRSVTTIEDGAFDNVDNLTSANFLDKSSSWTVSGFSDSKTISVSNSTTAAQYLRDDYYNYTWTKN